MLDYYTIYYLTKTLLWFQKFSFTKLLLFVLTVIKSLVFSKTYHNWPKLFGGSFFTSILPFLLTTSLSIVKHFAPFLLTTSFMTFGWYLLPSKSIKKNLKI